MPSTPEQDREDVRRLLERINGAWLQGTSETVEAALDGCFHEEVVFRGPGMELLGRGRDVCAGSYAGFLRQATVRECTLSEPEIDLAGDTAVASYGWEMTYQLDGTEYSESGRDLFVLARGEGGWRAVWRAMLPAPAAG
jgi:ketosteroid isomerase-like protein